MSYYKRQELFKDVNPLLKKYNVDGDIPPSYIPAQKRRMISCYMGRSSLHPGSYGKLKLLPHFVNSNRTKVGQAGWQQNHQDVE